MNKASTLWSAHEAGENHFTPNEDVEGQIKFERKGFLKTSMPLENKIKKVR